jgi:hypothetical protein
MGFAPWLPIAMTGSLLPHKRIPKLDRWRLKGLSGAQNEFEFVATVQNLRRMAKRLVPMPSK